MRLRVSVIIGGSEWHNIPASIDAAAKDWVWRDALIGARRDEDSEAFHLFCRVWDEVRAGEVRHW